MKTFKLTEDHLTLLRAANVRWEDCESGAPAIDCKRPYGNSDVEMDVARHLRWEVQENDDGERFLTRLQGDSARELHQQTLDALSVLLDLADIDPGDYAHDPEIGWFRVDEEYGPERTLRLFRDRLIAAKEETP